MSIISNGFFIFTICSIVLYYIVPAKYQSWVLLLVSLLFYVSYGIKPVLFILFATIVTYATGVIIDNIYSESAESPDKTRKKCRRMLIVAMLLVIGILAFLKYSNFVIDNVNSICGSSIKGLNLIMPLGISYYTFQSVGYLLDVFWKRQKAEHSFFRLALFLSFFPYMVQGPINRYGQLANQLYESHKFDWNNIRYGVVRIIWGLFKTMVLAGWAGIYREAIFANPDQYSGIAIFGTLLYTVELYGNFSGGIDIVLGVSRMFGVTMEENFKRPFFSTSIADFWHRWHITLGTWMKDYLFYPITLSKWMKKCGKNAKKLFGKKVGRNIPACIANIIVFFVVGIWHGASWGNIGWGLYNGVLIAFSVLAADWYLSWKQALHINDKSKGWHLFMVLRTFILMNISWYFDCASSFGHAVKMMKYSVTRFNPSEFLSISSGKLGTAYTPYALLTIVAGCILLFVISYIQEKGTDVQEAIARKPVAVRVSMIVILLIITLALGPMSAGKGFIYAQF